MVRPSVREAEAIAETGEFQVIPMSTQILSDVATPIQVLRILKNVSKHCFLLESMEDKDKWGRYTFLGFKPKLELSCLDKKLTIRSGTTTVREAEDPDAYIRQILEENKSPRFSYLPPFTGGLVGYFSYEYLQYAEPALRLDSPAGGGEEFQDLDLMLFDKIVAFDHVRQTITLIVNVKAGELADEYRRGERELLDLVRLIREGEPAKSVRPRLCSAFREAFTKEEYCQMVERAKEYIKEGEIFQAVLSNRLEADFEGSLLDAYRLLRTTNPSPYLFYLGSDEMELAGASPETLVRLEGGKVSTFPLAGTRPRGRGEEEDLRLERELLADEKELAEHNMLVDLGRNDLGKISEIGTVKLERYLNVERFSHVMHLGSTVSGSIRNDKDGVDAVKAVLPAGTRRNRWWKL